MVLKPLSTIGLLAVVIAFGMISKGIIGAPQGEGAPMLSDLHPRRVIRPDIQLEKGEDLTYLNGGNRVYFPVITRPPVGAFKSVGMPCLIYPG